MRTTVDIEDDLMRLLKKKAQKTNVSLKRVLNAALRRGIEPAPERPRHACSCPTFSMGKPVGTIDLDRALTLAQMFEDDEILRKLQLRK